MAQRNMKIFIEWYFFQNVVCFRGISMKTSTSNEYKNQSGIHLEIQIIYSEILNAIFFGLARPSGASFYLLPTSYSYYENSNIFFISLCEMKNY